ncbi:MAG TPA: hypothetical protein VK549_15115 [Acidimicrobiia bacterium]|nr:hypothetical protein [Acidimicrobiia bacterium]
MARLSDPVFKGADLASENLSPQQDLAALKTYRYLRLGMLAVGATLAFAIGQEFAQPSVDCFLGSVSGYYYTPVHSIFIGGLVAIGAMLLVIKGRTVLEDASLSFAGVMAPIVAFLPTSDDVQGVCRPVMLSAGRYEAANGSPVAAASINNNLHALLFTGYVALALLLIAYLIQRKRWNGVGSPPEYTVGTWVGWAIGLGFVIAGTLLLKYGYSWVLEGHARAACAMFLALAVAALANGIFGLTHEHTRKVFAWIYIVVGVLMVVSGIAFIVLHEQDRSLLGGHLVLVIEAIEIGLFMVFWATQTVERWNRIA